MDRRAEVRSIVVMRGIPCRAYRELGHQPTVIRAAMMETDYAVLQPLLRGLGNATFEPKCGDSTHDGYSRRPPGLLFVPDKPEVDRRHALTLGATQLPRRPGIPCPVPLRG